MRIAIAGGSMAGLFAAALLRQAGHEVQIFERSVRGLEGRGAGLVVQQEVLTLLHRLRVPEVAAVGVVARDRITLGRDGNIIDLDPRSQMQMSWDHLYVAVRMLLDDGIYQGGRPVIGAVQTDRAAWLELDVGTLIEADLVVGADGIGSAVRAAVLAGAVAPGQAGPSYAGYVAWRSLLPEDKLPAVADDMLTDRFAFYHMPGGQTLGYTVAGPNGELEAGKRRYNCVWYRRTPDLAGALTDRSGRVHAFSLPPGGVRAQAQEQLVADAKALLPAPFAAVFAEEPQPFVQAIFDMETPVIANRRLALIGDSAFVARPHTAMGVAKAAGDAFALLRAVERGWTEEARATFDRERRITGRAIVSLGRRLGASL
ncbi:FAD binding domain-containing protein [Sphingomonas sp. OTU376]|uniref:FAD binding domain-containing protein n=1 Tax=Sphingomonas sp. OTU376 TaxID=3043863 RepID=UPI00313D3FDE